MSFQCDRCGICCRTHRVPLTAFDLARLLDAPELRLAPPEKGSVESDFDPEASVDGEDEAFGLLKYVEWLTAEQVDLLGEPESLVRAREGSALLVLKHRGAGSARSACVFLHPESGCTIHSSRPSSCRTYPFDRAEPAAQKDTAAQEDTAAQKETAEHTNSALDRLGTHPDYLCPPETLVRQTVQEANQDPASENSWVQSVKKRDQEAHLHADYVARWNLRQRTRVKLGKVLESRVRFLRWVLQISSGPQTTKGAEDSLSTYGAKSK